MDNQANARDLYLDLLKKTLTFTLWPEPPAPLLYLSRTKSNAKRKVTRFVDETFQRFGMRLVVDHGYSRAQREGGEIWPSYADTMVGLKRLDNLQYCVETVLADDIPGDFIETGVWRGGACIFMQAVLKAHGAEGRRIFVADSFEGLPPPTDTSHPSDLGSRHFRAETLKVSLEEVKHNFERYGMLDDNLVFLKGYFSDTLPTAPVDRLAILRLDGDMYGSTMDALENLYPKLSPGGFCIIDDYSLPPCAKAVHDYREAHGITEPFQHIDNISLFWRKSRD